METNATQAATASIWLNIWEMGEYTAESVGCGIFIVRRAGLCCGTYAARGGATGAERATSVIEQAIAAG